MAIAVNPDDILPDPAIPSFAQDVKEQFGRVRDKFEESISFPDFGAVGDGTTDNSTAWSNFVEYLIANNVAGKIPPGDYYISTAPGTIPSDTSTSQVDVPAIDLGTSSLIINGAGKEVTSLISKRGVRTGLSEAEVSWPILRLLNGQYFELSGVTLDGAFEELPSPLAETLDDSTENRVKARNACTLVETDGTSTVDIRDVRVTGFYGVRDQTAWAADPSAHRTRRTGGLCVHRADVAVVRNLELGANSFREGVFFMNYGRLDLDGFRFVGDVQDQIDRGGSGLSTPLNAWGPENGAALVRNVYIRNNRGSAINGYADSFTVDNWDIGSDLVGSRLGSGLDFGLEIQGEAFEDHPRMRRLVITNGRAKACNRYTIRVYLSTELPADQIILDGLVAEDCYQGPEFGFVKNLIATNISITRPFWREDYDVQSGRGFYLEDVDSVILDNIIIDGEGGSGDNVMKLGFTSKDIRNILIGNMIIKEATQSHFSIYNAALNPPGLTSNVHLGNLHCYQGGSRDGSSIFYPIHLSRSGFPIENLSFGKVFYNGTPAVEQADTLFYVSDNRVNGLQDLTLGDSTNIQTYKNVLAQIKVINGDATGTYPNSVSALISANAGRSLGRGSDLAISTRTVNDALSETLTLKEHGSVIFHDTATKTDPVARIKGETWFDTDKMYVCTASGSIFGAPLAGVTATADGTNVIVVSDATGISNSMWITVDGALREVENVSGTNITLDATVTTGTGLAVAYATPTIREFQFV